MSLSDFDNKYKNLIGNKAADRFNPNSPNYDKQTLEKLSKSYQKTFISYNPQKALGKSFNVYSEYSTLRIWLLILSLLTLGVLSTVGFTLLDDPKTTIYNFYLSITVICWLSLIIFLFTIFDNLIIFNIFLFISIAILSGVLYQEVEEDKHKSITISLVAISTLIALVLLFYYIYPEPDFNPELERYRTKEEKDRKLKNLANHIRKEQEKAVVENEKKWEKLKLNQTERNKIKNQAIADYVANGTAGAPAAGGAAPTI